MTQEQILNYIHSVTTDLPLRMMGMMDEKAPQGCPAYASVDKKKCGFERQKKDKQHDKKRYTTLQKLQHRKPIRVKKGVSRNIKTGDKMFSALKSEIRQ